MPQQTKAMKDILTTPMPFVDFQAVHFDIPKLSALNKKKPTENIFNELLQEERKVTDITSTPMLR